MHPTTIFVLSLLLLWLKATTAAFLGDQLIGAIKKCIDKEKHALLDFKAHLQKPNGQILTWRSKDDCCKWSGVTCNHQTGHVTKLELSYDFGDPEDLSGIRGEISHSLLNLSYLNHLDLSYNSFHGTIPKFIGSMTQLRYLNLGFNNFSGNIPRSIGSLKDLRFLDLSYNTLHGPVPLEFGNLRLLRTLSLGPLVRSKIENLDWLSHLSHLQSLHMEEISLAKANHWVNVILSLRKLSYLSLMECNLSEVMYPYSSFVNSSSSIGSLSLINNNLNSSMYRWLFPLTSNRLFHLDLSENMLDGIPRYLGNLCGLTSLFFNGNLKVIKFPDFLNHLSGCTSITLKDMYARGSQFTESLSDEIKKFPSLETLDLSHNHLNGTISERVWELHNLETFDVSSNSLRGHISEKFLDSEIRMIDFSNNPLEMIPSKAHMSNLSYVEHLDLSSCKLGPHFPKQVQTLKNLAYLDISNSRISDTIPIEFWNMWPTQLKYLNLSSNKISGKVPDLLSNFDLNPSIDLSSNNFDGPIPNVPPSLLWLNLSKNKFYGGISFLCEMVDGVLSFLDLSHNSLTGKLPDCLWHFKDLKVLNLGHNKFSGRLPASIGYMAQLKVLHLYNNNFLGELPLALMNCTELSFLNLGTNNFSGNVPIWIGENLTGLYALSLRSNNFFGPIPSKLCDLVNLQYLDLSMNNLNGTIPSCVNNLDTMVQGRYSLDSNTLPYALISKNGVYYILYFLGAYVDSVMIYWQGNEHELTSSLGFLISIDLSSNNLTGSIPNELIELHGLLVLNLSKNSLQGEIPRKIGGLKELLTLDLSKNNFSGGIPSSMSQMDFLNYLDLSYNNLSGRIPSSTQLQLFKPSSYTGNAGLCGPPITQNCANDEKLAPSSLNDNENGGEGTYELQIWFYIGGGIGFITGFWTACGTLLLIRRWRLAFFHFLEDLKDWVYIKLVVFIRKLQRGHLHS